nr:NTP transferase domain-containing protein [Methanocella sp. CWC-04]
MSGGRGKRMGSVEKPMLLLEDKPLISYVVDALKASSKIENINIAISENVPLTEEYLRDTYGKGPDVRIIMTPGKGYIEDTRYAVELLSLNEPFLILSSDIPMITPDVIDDIITAYENCGKEALSVWVDESCLKNIDINKDLTLDDSGRKLVPCGINVINGKHIDRPQEESAIVYDNEALAININYPKDLEICRELIKNSPSSR